MIGNQFKVQNPSQFKVHFKRTLCSSHRSSTIKTEATICTGRKWKKIRGRPSAFLECSHNQAEVRKKTTVLKITQFQKKERTNSIQKWAARKCAGQFFSLLRSSSSLKVQISKLTVTENHCNASANVNKRRQTMKVCNAILIKIVWLSGYENAMVVEKPTSFTTEKKIVGTRVYQPGLSSTGFFSRSLPSSFPVRVC